MVQNGSKHRQFFTLRFVGWVTKPQSHDCDSLSAHTVYKYSPSHMTVFYNKKYTTVYRYSK